MDRALCAVCFVMAATIGIEVVVPARGVPLTQMWRCSTHSLCAIRSEGPDMTDHLEREETVQTWLFSQL